MPLLLATKQVLKNFGIMMPELRARHLAALLPAWQVLKKKREQRKEKPNQFVFMAGMEDMLP